MTNPSSSRHCYFTTNNHKKAGGQTTRSISPIPTVAISHSLAAIAAATATATSAALNRNRKGSASLVGGGLDLALESKLVPPIISPEPISGTCASTITAAKMTKKKKIFKERWVCDVCRVAAFDDYEQACIHEENCGKEQQQHDTLKGDAVLESLDHHGVEKDRDSVDDSVVLVAEEDMTQTQERNEMQFDDAPEGENAADFENTPMVPKKLKFSSLVEMKRNRKQQKQQQHTCHFNPCEVCHVNEHSSRKSSKREGNDTAGKTRRNRTKAATTGKSDATSKTKNTLNVTKNAPKNATMTNTAPTAPLFLKSTKQKKTNDKLSVESTSDAMDTSSKTVAAEAALKDKGNKNDNKTPRTIAFASIFEKHPSRKNVTKMSDDMDPIVASDQTSPTILSEKEQKAILAEHRAAEFVSKRRKQMQEERERQKKREEQRKLNPLFLKQTNKEILCIDPVEEGSMGSTLVASANTCGVGNNPSRKRQKGNSGKSIESPIDLTESAECSVVVKRNEKKVVPSVDVNKYPPRFPNPSHIGHKLYDDDEHKRELLYLLDKEKYDVFVSTSRHAQSMDSVSLPDALPPYKYHIGGSEYANNEDYLFMHFSSVFRPWEKYGNDNNIQETNQLWSDKHTMQAIPHSVYGDTNKEVAENLISFINDWKNHRQQVCDARAEKAAKLRGVKKKAKKRLKKYDHDDDDDDFLSDDDSGGLRSVYLLTGESGSGKTSIAHAAARHCQCKLIEINTSMERSGKALKKEIEECSQSLSNLSLLKKDDSVTGGILQEEDDEVLQGPSLSVILIDEVDLIFESDGDTGFWQSLSNVAKKAKCPIILTATIIPTNLKNSTIPYEHSILVRPSPFECASKMTQIAKAEKMRWRKDLNGEDIKKVMATIAKFCECDLRKIMNEMQVYALGSKLSTRLNVPQKAARESFGNECSHQIKYPRVKSVKPSVVPSRSYSVVTIKGSNFLRDGLATVTVGDQVALSRILDEHTIVAVVPPCQISPYNDRFARVQHSLFEESLHTRYASVSVSIEGKNGFALKSKLTASDLKPFDTSVPVPTFLQYSFDDQIDGDTDEESDENIPTYLRDINPEVLLEREANVQLKQLEAEGVDLSLNPSVVSCSPLSPTQEESDIEMIMELSKKFEYSSDLTLFRDTNDYLKLPLIAGYVQGSDHVTNDDVSSVCGWEDPSSCSGISDCYITLPSSRRDRLLTSKACFLSNKSTFHCDIINNSSCENDDGGDDGLFTLRSMEEESYLSQTLDSNLFVTSQSITYARDLQSTISMFVASGISDWERDEKIDTYSALLEPVMNDARFVNFPFPDFYWLDYVPNLRKIAFIAAEADKNYASLNLNCSDDKSQRKRRSTRRSAPKERLHYFDTLLGSSRGSEANVGKDIGDELARLYLQYDDCKTRVK